MDLTGRSALQSAHGYVILQNGHSYVSATGVCPVCLACRHSPHLRSLQLILTEPALQFLELGFEVYKKGYTYAAVLMFISVVASFLGVQVLYRKRMELYGTIQQQHVVPIVTAGRVR